MGGVDFAVEVLIDSSKYKYATPLSFSESHSHYTELLSDCQAGF